MVLIRTNQDSLNRSILNDLPEIASDVLINHSFLLKMMDFYRKLKYKTAVCMAQLAAIDFGAYQLQLADYFQR